MSAMEMGTYEARLATFSQTFPKRRNSTVYASNSSSLKWPHNSPSMSALAKAGFYFKPTIASPDNVVCYLCSKNLDGWEENDDPINEHVQHSSDCGWALHCAIERRDELSKKLEVEDPHSQRLTQARSATFGDSWPHDGKKGWTCKKEKMIDAGWVYCPTAESDDFVSCAYCNLSLDGWEPKDDPMSEHLQRAPDCPFFKWSKTAKPKKSRASRVSRARLSTQSRVSVSRAASPAPEVEDDDTMLTAATSQTVTSPPPKAKKGAKAKKTTKRGKQAKAKDEPEPSSFMEPEDDDFEVKVSVKPVRGKKRKSSVLEDPVPELPKEEPAPKRRMTRSRASVDVENITEPELQAPKTRKGRSSSISFAAKKNQPASKASLRRKAEEDEEIERRLEAELDHALSGDEAEVLSVPDPVPKKGRSTKSKATKAATKVEPEVQAVEDVEMADQPVEAPLDIVQPKTRGGRTKASTAKSTASKARTRRTVDTLNDSIAESAMDVDLEPVPKNRKASAKKAKVDVEEAAPTEEATEIAEEPAPVKPKGRQTRKVSTKRTGRARANTVEEAIVAESIPTLESESAAPEHAIEQVEAPAQKTTKAPAKKSKKSKKTAQEEIMPSEDLANETTEMPAESSVIQTELIPELTHEPLKQKSKTKAKKTGKKAPPSSPPRVYEEIVPSSPPAQIERPLTPESEHNDSDLENTHPSSHPRLSSTHQAQARIALAETPGNASRQQSENSKGLKSTQPWTAVDLQTVFMKSPFVRVENGNQGDHAMALDDMIDGVKGAITSPEKRMTVEEWIRFNAKGAEMKLRGECERMVGIFEQEGLRALKSLEGLETIE